MRVFWVTLVCGLWLSQGFAQAQETSDQCEAAFELHQTMTMTMSLNGVAQLQHINVSYDIYVRSVPVPEMFAEREKLDGLVAYVFLVDSPLVDSPLTDSKLSENNGNEKTNANSRAHQPYPNPFLVVADAAGALVSLQSTANDISVLKAYRSFYDSFQFSWLPNNYQYQNGIGRYEAFVVGMKLEPTSEFTEAVLRKNKGYANTESPMAVQLLESDMRYYQKESTDGCFFDKADGTDVFSQTLNADTYVDIDASIRLTKKDKSAEEFSTQFLALTNNVSEWPSFSSVQQRSPKEIEQQLPVLMLSLSSLVSDKEAFYARLKEDSSLLPYLHDYLQTNTLENDLSKKLYWALDRLNTVESVSLLVKESTNANSDRDRYRSALALSSTNAPISDVQLNDLINHVHANSMNTGYSESHLVYVRLLGVVAGNRNQYHPEQARSLRNYLYSQVGMNDTALNKAVLDSVGNLGDAIDEEGFALLLTEAQFGSATNRISAIDALGRLALDAYVWQQIQSAYATEKILPVRQRWLKLMAHASTDNIAVKSHLMQALESNSLRITALNSLSSVGFKLGEQDVALLKAHLKKTQNPIVQNRLAALIIKANRLNN